MKFLITLFTFFIFFITSGFSQNFLNSDLDGPPITGASILPYFWQSVPTGYPCMANASFAATPDLTNPTLPVPGAICGIPYSGSTFVSGLWGSGYHEGIMQTVSGFCTGCTYSINFFQSVVKQLGHVDSSGCWSVYINNVLAGQSIPTYSLASIGSNTFTWDFRSINFTANATTITFKILPSDDDPLWTHPYGLRMGIDSIYILPITTLPIKLLSFNARLVDDKVILNWKTSSEINNDFFTIEKSRDGNEWSVINKIKGGGNSTGTLEYSEIDFYPFSEISYYRLKQTDFDGSFSYSNVIIVNDKDNESIHVFSNPLSNVISVENNKSTTLKIFLCNMNQEIIEQVKSYSKITSINTVNFSEGIYILLIMEDGNLVRREKIFIY